MVNLVYKRIVAIKRAQRVQDAINGARMELVTIASNVSADIQLDRARPIRATNAPTGVTEVNPDSLPEWKLFSRSVTPVLKGDTVIDDLAREFIVAAVYATPFGIEVSMYSNKP